MNYRCSYRNNPMFPYSNTTHKLKKRQPLKSTASDNSKDNFYFKKKLNSPGFLDKFLYPKKIPTGKDFCQREASVGGDDNFGSPRKEKQVGFQ